MFSELRFALRALRATPGFTAVALVVLTLGIGATTAIFSVVDGIALRGLPFERADRLVFVEETNPTGKGIGGGYVAAPNFFDFRAQQRVFEDMAAYQSTGGFTIRDGGEPQDLRATMVSASLFSILRVQPAVGHAFTPENEVRGNHRVAVISDGLWRARFHADPQIVGKTMTFDSGVWEILGVMPAGFAYPIGLAKPRDLWVPFVPTADEMPRGTGDSRNYNAQVVARLKDGVSIAQARAQMEVVTAALKAQYPKWFRDRWIGITPLHESIVGKARSWMLMLLAAVAFVLLIACVNVANLLLARATARSRDVGIRAAMGATRWQLARGLLIESLLLSLAGTACGVAVAFWGVDVLRASLPSTLPRLAEVGINLRVLAAAAAAAIATGVAFGVIPAWQFSRPNLATTLREGGRSGGVGLARQRVRTMLLVAEVALAVMLLIGAGLFASSFVRLMNVDIGLDYKNVLSVGVYPKVDFSKEHIDADMARAGVIVADVLERVKQLPGVAAAATVSGSLPMAGGWSRTQVTVPGRPPFEDPDDNADIKTISPGYFGVIHVPVLAGRAFTDADGNAGAPAVVMLNDIAAKRYFDAGQNPIGVEVKVNGKRTVVGIVRSVRLQGPESDLRPEVYVPFTKTRAFGASVVVRTSGDSAAIIAGVRAAIHNVMPDVVVPEPVTMESLFEKLIVQRKFNMLVLALFGVLAIVIAGVGIYGVMAVIVEQRTQEIGVRMALGARPGQVLRMVLSRAAIFMTMGLAMGLGSGWMLAQLVQAFLFKVEAHDPAVYAAAAGVLMAAGLVAALVPARRAARVDPLTALR